MYVSVLKKPKENIAPKRDRENKFKKRMITINNC
jgi:hypothetical protein